MTVEQGIDELIEAGRRVLSSDFDDGALQEWQRKAAFWMNVLADGGHADAKYPRSAQHDSSRDSARTSGDRVQNAGGREVQSIACLRRRPATS